MMRVRPLGRTFTVVRFSKLARSCDFAARVKVIARAMTAVIPRRTDAKGVLPKNVRSIPHYNEMRSRTLRLANEYSVQGLTQETEDSCKEAFSFGFDVSDDG